MKGRLYWWTFLLLIAFSDALRVPTEVTCLNKWRGGGEEEEQKDQEDVGECEVKEEGVGDRPVVDAVATVTTPPPSEGTEESQTISLEAQNKTSSSVTEKVR